MEMELQLKYGRLTNCQIWNFVVPAFASSILVMPLAPTNAPQAMSNIYIYFLWRIDRFLFIKLLRMTLSIEHHSNTY